MRQNNTRSKKLVYVSAFVGQNVSLLIGNLFYRKYPAFFLIMPLMMALFFYFIYHKINMPTMRSYMGIQCISAVTFCILERIIATQKNKDKLLPPNDAGPILYIIGTLMILFMVLLPVIPVCIVYRKRHSHL